MKLEVKVAYALNNRRFARTAEVIAEYVFNWIRQSGIRNADKNRKGGEDHVVIYPDGYFLISETNINGNPNYTFRKISGPDAAMSFAYTVK